MHRNSSKANSAKFARHRFYFSYGSWPVWTGAMSRDVYYVRRSSYSGGDDGLVRAERLVDGRGMSWRAIGDPSEANEEETAVPGEHLDGVANPVWDAERQRLFR